MASAPTNSNICNITNGEQFDQYCILVIFGASVDWFANKYKFVRSFINSVMLTFVVNESKQLH